jgi:hypothetical protein
MVMLMYLLLDMRRRVDGSFHHRHTAALTQIEP